MTNDEVRKLSERAVACEAWEWLPGMLVRSTTSTYTDRVRDCDELDFNEYIRQPMYVDLGDPATLGCLIELVRRGLRESCRHPGIIDTLLDGFWIVRDGRPAVEPWVSALECFEKDQITTGES